MGWEGIDIHCLSLKKNSIPYDDRNSNDNADDIMGDACDLYSVSTRCGS